MKHLIPLAALALLVALPARADGDPEAGKKIFGKCAACHAVEAGKNKIGPTLHAIVGRTSASGEGFAYSDAMKAAKKTWDEPTLLAYLTEPKAVVPGTKMVFPALKEAKERDDVVAYLKTLR